MGRPSQSRPESSVSTPSLKPSSSSSACSAEGGPRAGARTGRVESKPTESRKPRISERSRCGWPPPPQRSPYARRSQGSPEGRRAGRPPKLWRSDEPRADGRPLRTAARRWHFRRTLRRTRTRNHWNPNLNRNRTRRHQALGSKALLQVDREQAHDGRGLNPSLPIQENRGSPNGPEKMKRSPYARRS